MYLLIIRMNNILRCLIYLVGLYNITPIENKISIVNIYTYEASKRLLEKQKSSRTRKT